MAPNVTDYMWDDEMLQLQYPDNQLRGTNLDRTTWVLDKLCKTKNNHVRAFLNRYKGQNLARLLDIKKVYKVEQRLPDGLVTKVVNEEVPFNLQGINHAMSFAYVLFGKKNVTFDNACTTCNRPRAGGPWRECIVTDADGSKMACTNCIYSGKSSSCSHRLDAERKVKVENAKAEGKIFIKNAEDIAEVDDETLEQWAEIVNAGIAKKEKERDEKKREQEALKAQRDAAHIARGQGTTDEYELED